MQYTLNNKSTDGIGRIYDVTIAASALDAEVDKKLQEVASRAHIAGFRPGKAPLQVLRLKYGKDVRQDAINDLIKIVGDSIIKDEKIKPVGSVGIQEITPEKDGSVKIKYTAMELPEFNIDDLANLKIKKNIAVPSDKEITESLDQIAKTSEKTAVVKSARAYKDGDTLVVNCNGKVDGKAFEGSEMKLVPFKLGANMGSPEFEKQIRTVKVGEKKSFPDKFPKGLGNKDLAGKEVIFDVEVTEHREPVASKVDNELAKSLGMESIDELKKMVSDSLSHQYDNLSVQLARRSLLDEVYNKFKFKPPTRIVDNEFNAIWQQVLATKEKGELSPNESKLSEDDLKKEYRKIAERRSCLGILLSHIAQLKNITVEKEEVEKAIAQESQRYAERASEFQAAAMKNPQIREAIEAPLFENKIIDWVMRRVQMEEVKISSDELMLLSKEDDDVKGENSTAKKTKTKKSTTPSKTKK